jgi:hypothetical protein
MEMAGHQVTFTINQVAVTREHERDLQGCNTAYNVLSKKKLIA